MLLIGLWFYICRKNTAENFAVADRSLTAWPLGLSIFASYISSMAFFGLPGRAYMSNCELLVAYLAFPFAAFVVVKYIVPFYRAQKDICAYTHLARRFGRWASLYATFFYILSQIVYMGTIFYFFSIVIGALTDLNGLLILLMTGATVVVYTSLGGLKAVVYSDVVQAGLIILGVIVCAVWVVAKVPGHLGEIVMTGLEFDKFSLGDFKFSLTSQNAWLRFIVGFVTNIAILSFSQAIVQRYYAAKTTRDVKKSLGIVSVLFIGTIILLYFIGIGLFVFYQSNSSIIPDSLLAVDDGTVLPYFIFTEMPIGIKGLILTCVLAATMSTVDTMINSISTTIYSEIYKPFIEKPYHRKRPLFVLYIISCITGVVSIGVAMLFSPKESVLEVMHTVAGISSGGMFGLFLLGFISKKIENVPAMIATAVGTVVIAWVGVTMYLPASLQLPVHPILSLFLGTVFIVVLGFLLTGLLVKFRKWTITSRY